MKKKYYCILGFLTGFANGFFGSGGGLIAVPLLKKTELNAHESHASSLAITLPLSMISIILYLKSGSMSFSNTLLYIPAGLLGAVVGGLFFKKSYNFV